MNRKLYFVRKKSMHKVLDKLVDKYDMKVCFQNKDEIFLKNELLLIAFKRKYISVLLFNEKNNTLADDITTVFEEGK